MYANMSVAFSADALYFKSCVYTLCALDFLPVESRLQWIMSLDCNYTLTLETANYTFSEDSIFVAFTLQKSKWTVNLVTVTSVDSDF